jgi:hypothetical protein
VKNTRKRLQDLYGSHTLPEHPLKKQRAAYSVQKRTAKQRGIEWKFTFKEWWAWWQVDNRWENRGRGRGCFVMARIGDQGPYSPDNVYCATAEQNVKDTPYEVRSATNKAGWARGRARNSPLFNKGAGHPVSIPIETPAGRFANATEAAEHFGITRQGVRYRIKAGGKAGEMYLQRRLLKRTEGSA